MAVTKEEWGEVLNICYADPLTGDWSDLSQRVYFALTHSATFLSWTGATQASHPLVGAIVETIQSGGTYIFKRLAATDAGVSILITPNGSDNIDGNNTSSSIVTQYNTFALQSDGSNWWIIS